MPLYEFETPSGEIVEAYFHMGSAPSIGDTVRIDDLGLCRRVARPPHGVPRLDRETIGWQIHPKHPAIEHRDEHGRAKFSTESQRRAFCERSQAMNAENPAIPAFAHDAIASTEQVDRDTSDVAKAKRTKLAREATELSKEMRRRLRDG